MPVTFLWTSIATLSFGFVAHLFVRTSSLSTGCRQVICAQCRKSLTLACLGLSSCSSGRRGCSREALHEQVGMRCPARCLASNTREAMETHPPPLRADARSSQVFEGPWSFECRVGPDAINPAVERREASISRTRCKAPRKRLRAYVTGPRNGCRCTRAPIGAPPPRMSRGEIGKARRG
jgi:hypothetical protein